MNEEAKIDLPPEAIELARWLNERGMWLMHYEDWFALERDTTGGRFEVIWEGSQLG